MTLALSELVAAFDTGTLGREDWTHAAHLRVGAWYVHHHGAVAALELLRRKIRALNAHHGTENSSTGGYHETITAAYVHLIEDHLAAFEPGESLERRVDLLVCGPLGDKGLLRRYWSLTTLLSKEARAGWVAPDVAPLELPPEALALIRGK